ncbi:MAG: VacJ family lipoprotein [Campylobacteraceae bacterium]|nr:VacJ family lipoprotein [Campylobacteraceae bacterium]
MRVILAFLLTVNIIFANQKEMEVSDPLSGYNRVMTSINMAFYDYIMYPISYSYDYIMPDPIQGAISNFFDNLLYPMRLVNNLFQGKFEASWVETKRFFINTTIGFAGFSDAATLHFDIPKHSEDFGQTLAVWGVPSGAYIVWPIIGPSNLRDTVGLVADYFSDPLSYIEDDWTAFGVKAGRTINEDSLNPGAFSKEAKTNPDPYIFIRDSYIKKRNYEISK